jgi:hypothetical protein
MLRDILAAANEESISQHSKDEEGSYVLAPTTLPYPPALKGETQQLNLLDRQGLPPWLFIDARAAMFRTIQTNTSGASPPITWKLPITVATQM